MNFKQLQNLASQFNMVLERKRKRYGDVVINYSLYDNNTFTESLCTNLDEVKNSVKESLLFPDRI